MNIALKLEVTREEVDELELGLARWVIEFEEIYIQEDMKRIPIATLPLHYLLHLASSIRRTGPLWCSWAFPMERYCGSLLPAITSRRHPFRSIDRREKELEQIRYLKMKYNLHAELDLSKSRRLMRAGTTIEGYPNLIFLLPSIIIKPSPHMKQLITRHIVQKLSLPYDDFANGEGYLAEITSWGKLHFALGPTARGDTVHARQVVKTVGRDMSYVKFTAVVDANANCRNTPQHLEKRTCYGQLQHLFYINVVDDPVTLQTRPHLVALIRFCPTKAIEVVGDGRITLISTGGNLGALVAVDVNDIVGVAARVEDRGQWYFVERPGSLDFFKNALHIEDIEDTGD